MKKNEEEMPLERLFDILEYIKNDVIDLEDRIDTLEEAIIDGNATQEQRQAVREAILSARGHLADLEAQINATE